MPGLFITFEGPEGSGKTTQIKILKEYLEKQGFSVLITREPGGSKIGQDIRKILLSPDNKMMAERTELFLYAADRSQHVEEIIIPALKQDKIVLSDRFTHSTLAYQGYGRGLDMELIKQLNNQATKGLKPDLTILLDVEPQVGLKRAKARNAGDRIEQEEESFHLRVRKGFLQLVKENQDTIKVVDAALTKEQVSYLVKKLIDNFLGGKKVNENYSIPRG